MGNAPKVQISSLAGGASSINAITWAGASATTAPQYSFGKSRGATAVCVPAVVADDDLGFVSFYGSNGSGFNRAAYIKGQVNGTPGATNVPGRLAFYVGTDAAAPAEVMRVESTGVTVTGMGTFSSLGWTGVEYTAAGAALGPAIADYFTSTISLDASSIYDVECVAYFLKTTAGTATWTWTFSSAPDLISSFYSSSPLVGFITSTTGAPINAQAAARTAATLAHAATGSLTTAVYHVYRFKVLVRTNLATTMQLRVTSSAGTVTPQAGSFMRPTKVM
jgi:hypothetical protein